MPVNNKQDVLTLELSSYLFPMMLIQHSVNSDWLSNIQSRVLQADWFISENNEKATLSVNMPYSYCKWSTSYHCTVVVVVHEYK